MDHNHLSQLWNEFRKCERELIEYSDSAESRDDKHQELTAKVRNSIDTVSYTHLRAHETVLDLVY